MTDNTALFDVGVPQPHKDPAAAGAVETVIDEACRTLHLPTIRSRWEDLAATALKQPLTFKDFLADLLEAECLQREERKKARLVREANFPRPKRLEDFEFDKNPNIVPEQVNTLADPAWVKAGLPLCLIGVSGTGKSHLLIGIGTAIAEAGSATRRRRTS
jgi:DNA replication protein DnaC